MMGQKSLVSVCVFVFFIIALECCQASQFSQEYIKKTKEILNDYTEKDIRSYLGGYYRTKKPEIRYSECFEGKDIGANFFYFSSNKFDNYYSPIIYTHCKRSNRS